MDQRSDEIKQDIEETRASLDEKLSMLETKARETFDLEHQITARPLLALGASIAAGFVLGSLGGGSSTSNASGRGGSSSYGSSKSDQMLSQFDDEINILQSAAVAMVTGFLRDSIQEYVPALGNQFKQAAQQGWREGGEDGEWEQSSAPNTSFSRDSVERQTNYDEIPSVQNRFGNSSPVATGGSEYYDVAATRAESADPGDVRDVKRYTQ